MKVTILEGCIACGACESICPDVFVVEGETAVVKSAGVTEENRALIEEAASSCPVEVITVEG